MTETITLEEVLYKKQEVESKIRDIISEFMHETNAIIQDVEITYISNASKLGEHLSLGKVKCKVYV